MKQTAVEFLQEALSIHFTHEQAMQFIGLFNQVLEMEKQQIIDAHGNQTKKSGGISNATYILTGEQYYNETFNK